MCDEQLKMTMSTLMRQVTQQGKQIAELQKQLASMQLTSCELETINNLIEIKKVNGSTVCRISPL
ncbi:MULTISPECIES: hypothetical protein [Proteus]|uniref:hypothetical protein n=1 Tax=Proteus TaxID=583 RepID=UPI0029E54E12|nr:hypothetical protein [Proteus mirabilis]HEK0623022.1 hypothetical protein [Proteus mirabilis]